jgi:hypothetical protein
MSVMLKLRELPKHLRTLTTSTDINAKKEAFQSTAAITARVGLGVVTHLAANEAMTLGFTKVAYSIYFTTAYCSPSAALVAGTFILAGYPLSEAASALATAIKTHSLPPLVSKNVVIGCARLVGALTLIMNETLNAKVTKVVKEFNEKQIKNSKFPRMGCVAYWLHDASKWAAAKLYGQSSKN